MVRGGSSPLGRMEEAPLTRGFRSDAVARACDEAIAEVSPVARDALPHFKASSECFNQLRDGDYTGEPSAVVTETQWCVLMFSAARRGPQRDGDNVIVGLDAHGNVSMQPAPAFRREHLERTFALIDENGDLVREVRGGSDGGRRLSQGADPTRLSQGVKVSQTSLQRSRDGLHVREGTSEEVALNERDAELDQPILARPFKQRAPMLIERLRFEMCRAHGEGAAHTQGPLRSRPCAYGM